MSRGLGDVYKRQCSANTSVKALGGALRSGFFTHIVARLDLMKGLLDQF